MNKLFQYMASDTIDKNSEYYLRVGTSIGSWCILFFYLIPTLISIGEELFFKNNQFNPSTSGTIKIALYYIVNPIMATVAVKWQNRKLVKKSINFRKKYSFVFSLLFLVLILAKLLLSSYIKT